MDFIMHDLVNDLAKYVCGDFYFTLKDDESHNRLNMTRHVSFLGNPRDGFKFFETLYNANRLRTFLPICMRSNEGDSKLLMPNILMQELFSKFKFFRILSMSGFATENELPDTIGNLKHLSFLDIFGTKLIDCSLYNLQIVKHSS